MRFVLLGAAFAALALFGASSAVAANPPSADVVDLTDPVHAPRDITWPKRIERNWYWNVFPRVMATAKAAAIFVIRADGSVTDAVITESSGRETFDQAYLTDLLQDHFVPATRDGKPISVRLKSTADSDGLMSMVIITYVGFEPEKTDCLNIAAPELAIAGCTKMIQKHNPYPTPYLFRGWAYEMLGHHDEALADLNVAISRDHRSSDAVRARGFVYERLGNYAQAIEDYGSAMELNKISTAVMDRGFAYDELGKTELAAADFKAAAALMPECDGEGPNCRKSFDAQIAALDQKIAQNPNDVAAFGNRCILRSLSGHQLSMALADCNHVLDRLPNEPNVLEARGLAFLRMGQFTDAIEDFDGALTAQPKRTTSLYLRGIAKLHANDAAGGHADILAARSADPGIAVNLAFSGVLPR